MPINFDCAQCGKQFRNVRDEYSGKRLKCKCGHVIRAPEVRPAAASTHTDTNSTKTNPDSLGMSDSARATQTETLAPIVGTNQVDSIFGEGQAAGMDGAANPNPPSSGGYWGKPRLETPPEESEEAEEVANNEERIAKLKRRKTLQKTGPIVTRVCCGLSSLACFVIIVGSGLACLGLFYGLVNPQLSQQLSTGGVALGLANSVLTFVAACLLFNFSWKAFFESFSKSKRIVRSSLATAKAGASAMVFGMVTIICSIAAMISVIVHASMGAPGTTDIVGPIAMNIGISTGFLILAAMVYFAGRYRHGSVKLRYLFGSDSDSAE